MTPPFRLSALAQSLFYAAIILLLLLRFNTSESALHEKRPLAVFPSWPTQLSAVRPFTQGVENWLSDRIGLRQLWLIPPRLIDVYLFGISPSPLVVLGEHGTAFLQRHSEKHEAHRAIVKALGLDAPQAALIDKHITMQRQLAAWAHKAKLPVLFLAVPTSPVFRFDHLPMAVRHSLHPATEHPLQTAVERFRTEAPDSRATFLYPLQTGMEVAKQGPVYPLKNFHWTCSPFTTRVSEDILRALHIPVHRPLRQEDFQPCTTYSDLTALVGVPFPNWNDLCPSPAFYQGNALSAPALPQPIAKLIAPGPFVLDYRHNESVAQGSILALGDSFTPALCQPLARNVRKAVCLDYGEALRRGMDMQALLEALDSAYTPDALVIVSHDGFAYNPETIPGMNIFLAK